MPDFDENEKPKGWIMENYAKQKKDENPEEYKAVKVEPVENEVEKPEDGK